MEEYTVKENDTIFSISNLYGIPPIEIIRANNLKEPYNILKGQVLNIPTTTYNIYDRYVVRNKDTLYSIAKNANTTTDIIEAINGLEKNEYIYVGQTLLIPKKDIKIYITKEGDTLDDVSDYLKVGVLDVVYSNNNIFLLPDQLITYRKDWFFNKNML